MTNFCPLLLAFRIFPPLDLPCLLLFRCAVILRVNVNIYHHRNAGNTPGNKAHQEHSHGLPLLFLTLLGCFCVHPSRVLQDFKLPYELSQPPVLFDRLLADRTEYINERDILGI